MESSVGYSSSGGRKHSPPEYYLLMDENGDYLTDENDDRLRE